MEQTLFLKGVALFAAMVGLQQWIAQGISLYDIAFIGLVTAFLATLEADYLKYKCRIGTGRAEKENRQSAGESGAMTPGEPTSKKLRIGAVVS